MIDSNFTPVSLTAQCQFCKNDTPIELNFCVLCENQIKCLECNTQIYPGKTFCLKCGKSLIKKVVLGEVPNHYLRKVDQQGDNYSEHTEFSLSNEAVKEIAPFVIRQTMPNYKPPLRGQTSIPDTSEADVIDESDEKENDQPIATNPTPNASTDQAETHPKNSGLNDIFTVDGGNLVAKKTDFKGTTWSEQQRNFLVLYIQAYKEFFGKPVADREHFKAAAEKIKINDPHNFSNILTKFINSKVQTLSTGMVLNDEGEKDFKKILELVRDENTKAGFVYTNRTPHNSIRTKPLSKEDKTKIENWTSENVDLDKLDIRLVTSGRDAALLSLWIITKHLKKSEAVLWNEAMHYLKHKYKELVVTPEAVSKAILSKDNVDLFQKNNQGQYFLSPDGEKAVVGWISGTAEIKQKKEA